MFESLKDTSVTFIEYKKRTKINQRKDFVFYELVFLIYYYAKKSHVSGVWQIFEV